MNRARGVKFRCEVNGPRFPWKLIRGCLGGGREGERGEVGRRRKVLSQGVSVLSPFFLLLSLWGAT